MTPVEAIIAFASALAAALPALEQVIEDVKKAFLDQHPELNAAPKADAEAEINKAIDTEIANEPGQQ